MQCEVVAPHQQYCGLRCVQSKGGMARAAQDTTITEIDDMTDFVVAETEIRQLHARYTDAVWRKDLDAFGDCFAKDCEWRISGMILHGRDAVVEMMRNAFPKYRFILCNFRTPLLEVGEGTASGRTYMNEQSILEDGSPFGPIGIYHERFVDEGDQWRFSWRLFHTAYIGPPDLSVTFFENPDFGAWPAMPPLDAPSYNRAGILNN